MTRSILLPCLAACAAAASIAGCGNSAAPGVGSRAIAMHGAQPRSFNPHNDVIPKHVLTWAAIVQSNNISPTAIAPYIDWAVVNVPDANAFSAAGIKTVLYTNPNRTSPGGKMYTEDESTFAHDCNGSRITINGKPGPVYQMDARSANLAGVWSAWVQGAMRGGNHYDAIFDDSADSVRTGSAVPCNFDQLSWTAASRQLNGALGQQVIFNGLGTLTAGVTNPPPALGLTPTSYGGMLEGCYNNVGPSFAMPVRAVWQNYENSELTMSLLHKTFVCRGFSAAPADTSHDLRIYQYASFLLSYDPSSSIISEKFTNPSHVEAEPESGLVALDPLIPTPMYISGLGTAAYTYGRQYASCYLNGQAIGGCAVLVNADGPKHAHPFPWTGFYKHTLVMIGGGILDGGSVSVTGPAPASTIAGTSAEIATQ